jgi:E3 ubiquitin-protein ligase UBR7
LDSQCTLRVNPDTGTKGDVQSEEPATGNDYNQNFLNAFCFCSEQYDASNARGTMFQCLGLGTTEDGGCGEDWYHPECVVGLPRNWRANVSNPTAIEPTDKPTEPLTTDAPQNADADADADADEEAEAEDEFDSMPPGFPNEDDFEYFICHKCVDAFPWIKKYAGTPGFLPPVFHDAGSQATAIMADVVMGNAAAVEKEPAVAGAENPNPTEPESKKRQASPEADDGQLGQSVKRQRCSDDEPEPKKAEPRPTHSSASGAAVSQDTKPLCRSLPPAPQGSFSLFLTKDFRSHLCHCDRCYSNLNQHMWLVEEEDNYEPPISEDGDGDGAGSLGSRSLLDRGEAALSNVDRVRAIEGVMVYNHLKEKVKSFLAPFAESGKPVGAEDIKKYFEGLRGDAEAIRAAASGNGEAGDKDGDGRKEQSGY